jgi:hypothetical protein
MSSLIITEKLLQKTFYIWKKTKQTNNQYTISPEVNNLNDMQSGVISDKVYIFDLIRKRWFTQPKSTAQLLKYLIETL